MGRSKYYDENYLGVIKGSYKVVDIHPSAFNKNTPLWFVQCTCGKQIEVMPSQFFFCYYIRCSCGAQSRLGYDDKDVDGRWKITPADRQRILKYRWILIQRCYNSAYPSYHLYGALGISVHAEWMESTNKFVEWSLNNGYRPWLSIKRHNINKGYTPDNSYWGYEDGVDGSKSSCISGIKADESRIRTEIIEREVNSGRIDAEDVEDILKIASESTNIGGETSVRLRRKCLSLLANTLESSKEAMLALVAHNIKKDVGQLRRAEDNLAKAIAFLSLALDNVKEDD